MLRPQSKAEYSATFNAKPADKAPGQKRKTCGGSGGGGAAAVVVVVVKVIGESGGGHN